MKTDYELRLRAQAVMSAQKGAPIPGAVPKGIVYVNMGDVDYALHRFQEIATPATILNLLNRLEGTA